jgi:hypothetical protein
MKPIILLLLLLVTPWMLWAQEVGFMGIQIGMSRSEVIARAESSDLIEVPKNRDVEFFPVEDRKILTLSVKPEAPYIYLQFFDDVLLSLTVLFDERHIDYYTLIGEMEQKYGKHTRITPLWREWEIGSSLIKVEKPAVVKYMALDELVERSSLKMPEKYPHNERKAALLEGL